MPRSLAVTRVLLYLMFGLTLLGGVGVLDSLLELGSRVTPTLTLLALYAVAPGIAAVVLARRLWTGGKVVWFALIALQAWLLVGSIVNLYGGSERGLSQLLLPGALVALLSAGASRAWFERPAEQRAVRPRWTRERLRRVAVPSIPHVIGWRRNRGQSTVEYVGMVGLVALIIGTLVLSGVGTQLAGGLQTAVCTILGGDCESDTVAGGGGESGGGDNGGGDSGGGNSGGGNSGGGDSGGGDSGGGSDGGGSGGGSDGGGSDSGGSDGGSDSGGSDGGSDSGGSDGGSDSGGSDSGGSDGGSDSGGSDGGSDSGGSDGGSDSGGSDGGSDSGGSDGGSDSGGSSGGVECNPVMAPWGITQSCTETGTGGSDGGGSDGGSDGGGSDGGGSDGGSDGGGSDGGGSDGGSDGGGSDGGGSDGGGSDGGGSNGGGSDGGSDGGGSDGGSDGGGSSGGVECNPVMAPWGIMQSCTETGTGGSDGGGSDGGGSDGGGSDGGGSDGGGSDGGGSDGGGSDGGGSDGGGSSGGVECNPVMAPWGITQSCTETGTGGSDGGGSGGSSGGKNDDNKDDDTDEDNDDDKDDNDNDDGKKDCRDGTKVAFFGPVTTGAAGDGRYTLASAAVRTRVVVSGVTLAADPGSASAMDLVQSLSGFSIAGVDTYQDAENRLSNALGLTDEPRPEPEPASEREPEPGPDGGSCPERPNPMTALDGVPKYRNGDRKNWSEEVEKKADENPLTEDLTAEDALIIADYTGPWAEDANKYLRGQPISGLRAGRVPEFIEKMDRALEHLPPVEGTFYRGTFMPDELMERFANGEQVEMPEYLSTSSDPAKADRAAENAKANGRKGENVVMEVITDNGRNIDPLSRYSPKESEVLIPRGGKFEQVGVKTKIIGGKEYKVIQVKQVG
ncbi:ADP-ribosyltransferase [Streptomyces sp. NPDC102274]|uniref:ADP-ribosyltransferase n=1 Tax=Streptomyces sp. NPDC102274 TaxID=3366151 RepID=UPI0038102021